MNLDCCSRHTSIPRKRRGKPTTTTTTTTLLTVGFLAVICIYNWFEMNCRFSLALTCLELRRGPGLDIHFTSIYHPTEMEGQTTITMNCIAELQNTSCLRLGIALVEEEDVADGRKVYGEVALLP